MEEVLPVLVASFIEDGFQLQPARKAPAGWLISHGAHPGFGHASQPAAAALPPVLWVLSCFSPVLFSGRGMPTITNVCLQLFPKSASSRSFPVFF